jgi:hypothetical protein
MKIAIGLVVLFCIVLLAGCGPSCKLRQQRCHDGVAQLCGTDKKWRDVLDCSKLRRLKTCGCDGEPAICTCRRTP